MADDIVDWYRAGRALHMQIAEPDGNGFQWALMPIDVRLRLMMIMAVV